MPSKKTNTMNQNTIITVGRQFGSGGREIGKMLAETFGYTYYDKELISVAAQESGLCEDVFEKADERASSSLAYVFPLGFSYMGMFSPYHDILSNDGLFKLQSDAIRKLAEKEACVIIGRSADYILKDSKDIKLLRAFIYAPDEIRIQNIMKSHSLSESDAKILLLEKDKRYHKRHLALTGSNRGDRHNRDILINSAFLGVEGTAEYLEELIQKKYGSGEE